MRYTSLDDRLSSDDSHRAHPDMALGDLVDEPQNKKGRFKRIVGGIAYGLGKCYSFASNSKSFNLKEVAIDAGITAAILGLGYGLTKFGPDAVKWVPVVGESIQYIVPKVIAGAGMWIAANKLLTRDRGIHNLPFQWICKYYALSNSLDAVVESAKALYNTPFPCKDTFAFVKDYVTGAAKEVPSVIISGLSALGVISYENWKKYVPEKLRTGITDCVKTLSVGIATYVGSECISELLETVTKFPMNSEHVSRMIGGFAATLQASRSENTAVKIGSMLATLGYAGYHATNMPYLVKLPKAASLGIAAGVGGLAYVVKKNWAKVKPVLADKGTELLFDVGLPAAATAVAGGVTYYGSQALGASPENAKLYTEYVAALTAYLSANAARNPIKALYKMASLVLAWHAIGNTEYLDSAGEFGAYIANKHGANPQIGATIGNIATTLTGYLTLRGIFRGKTSPTSTATPTSA